MSLWKMDDLRDGVEEKRKRLAENPAT